MGWFLRRVGADLRGVFGSIRTPQAAAHAAGAGCGSAVGGAALTDGW